MVDLGITYEEMMEKEREADIERLTPWPNGTYPFVISGGADEQSSNPKSAGRPMIKWDLAVTNPSDNKEKTITHYTVLPWRPDPNGEIITSGCAMPSGIGKLCASVGAPFQGSEINAEQYFGRGGRLKFKQSPSQVKNESGQYVDDPTKPPRNEIEEFVA